MVDEVEEVLTVDAEPARERPDGQRRLHRGHRQDRRPPGHPAQPRGPLRGRRRAPTSWRRPEPCRTRPPRSASSSPTTPGSCGACSPTPWAGRASRSWASAADGDEALELCRRHRPDALTLDLHMPGLDGLGVLRALRDGRAEPVPVVVVSAFSPAHGARAVDALAEGAFDLVAKPAFGESLEQLLRRARPQGHRGRAVRPRAPRSAADRAAPVPAPAPRRRRPRAPPPPRRAGRPRAASWSSPPPPAARARSASSCPPCPPTLGAGGLIVQHMPAGFTASLAARLDGAGALDVRGGPRGRRARARHRSSSPPAARTCALGDDRRLRLSDDAPEGGLRPRADFTIHDAARVFGRRVLLVVLTGMGKDGLDGARAVKARRRPRPRRGRVHLHRLRHAARGRRGRAGRPRPAAGRAAPPRSPRSCDEPAHPRDAPPTLGPALRPGARRDAAHGRLRRLLRAGPRASAASTCSSTSAARWSGASAPGPTRRGTADLAAYARPPEGRAGGARRLPGPRHDQRLPALAPSGAVALAPAAHPARARRSAAACARGAPAAPTAPRPTRWPPSAARRSPHARVDIKGTDLDRRMVARARQGALQRRRRPRRADRLDRALVPRRPGRPRSCAGSCPSRSATCCACRSSAAPTTSSCAATRSSTSPRRSATRCTGGSSTPSRPGGYLVVGSSERVAAARELGLTSPFHFIYRKG